MYAAQDAVLVQSSLANSAHYQTMAYHFAPNSPNEQRYQAMAETYLTEQANLEEERRTMRLLNMPK